LEQGPSFSLVQGKNALGKGWFLLRKGIQHWVTAGVAERRTPAHIPTLTVEPAIDQDWIHEIKHDGFRTLIRID
jgi:hypothetical protein